MGMETLVDMGTGNWLTAFVLVINCLCVGPKKCLKGFFKRSLKSCRTKKVYQPEVLISRLRI